MATEIYYVLGGSGFIRFDDRDEWVSTGTLLVIHPNTPHQVVPRPDETLEILVLSLPAWSGKDEIILDHDEAEILFR